MSVSLLSLCVLCLCVLLGVSLKHMTSYDNTTNNSSDNHTVNRSGTWRAWWLTPRSRGNHLSNTACLTHGFFKTTIHAANTGSRIGQVMP